MRLLSFESIQKKLDKKNEELLAVRALRKKLADKEKNICAAIETLQSQKLEVIFLQVKREIKNERLDVSSGSVSSLLEALRNSQQSSTDANSVKKVATRADDSISDSQGKFELGSTGNLESISKIDETGRVINEL